jgi:hypothetical protein
MAVPRQTSRTRIVDYKFSNSIFYVSTEHIIFSQLSSYLHNPIKFIQPILSSNLTILVKSYISRIFLARIDKSHLKYERQIMLILTFGSLVLLNWINCYAYAQETPGKQNVTGQQAGNTTQPQGVKITSPKAGEQVPVGKLTISGISSDNTNTDCKVSVNINDQKPYQNTTATGPSGENDYSKWTLRSTSDSQMIKEGINDLTSKLSCINNPFNLTKFYSINVTGILAASENTTSFMIPTPPVK